MNKKNNKQIFNPYLPSYEYIPDGEPHIFGDRLYIYGSHDRFGGSAERPACCAGRDRRAAADLKEIFGADCPDAGAGGSAAREPGISGGISDGEGARAVYGRRDFTGH